MNFDYESQMVDFIVEELQKKHSYKYIVKEMRNGNNIADVVFSDDFSRDKVIFDNFVNTYFYVHKIRGNKKVSFESIALSDKKSKKEFNAFLHKIERLGYIKITDDNIEVIKNIDFTSRCLMSIEAKLKDWKQGLNQAKKYKEYSDKVYVAIDEYYIDKVDLNQFYNENIGLISVNREKITFIHDPKSSKEAKLDIKYFIEDKFLSKILKTNSQSFAQE